MSTIHHEVVVWYLTAKDSQKLKTICQAWTRIANDLYIVDHSEELTHDCPICAKYEDDI